MLRSTLLHVLFIPGRAVTNYMAKQVVMLTRRGFTGFASCAICSLAGFIATEASAQNTAAPTASGVKRTVLSQMDGPMPGYVTINMQVEIEPGATVPRRTHPGIESTYVLEGEFELPVQGQPTRKVKAGDGFQIPPETPHAGANPATRGVTRMMALPYVQVHAYLNAGITSFANQRSCSLNSFGARPSAQ
jgi:quercetin dioxygenase-like cupin family protein